jgi:hypothetical protein
MNHTTKWLHISVNSARPAIYEIIMESIISKIMQLMVEEFWICQQKIYYSI